MPFALLFTAEAKRQLAELEGSNKQKHRKVLRTLGRLEENPKHPGLNSHKYRSVKGPKGEDMWEAYVENQTPAAFRVFYYYGAASAQITIFAITPHP